MVATVVGHLLERQVVRRSRSPAPLRGSASKAVRKMAAAGELKTIQSA
jgi:hypothetical protein